VISTKQHEKSEKSEKQREAKRSKGDRFIFDVTTGIATTIRGLGGT
jgi:hypothetical protein